MLIDTHAHLNFTAFDNNRNEVIKRCLEKDIWMLNVGTNYDTSKKAVEIAEKYEKGVYAAIGLHPEDILKEEFDSEKYKKLALSSKKVVAIGEIGLDYWRRPKTKKKREEFKNQQKELFKKQLDLAKELNLPVILHCRLGFDDLLEILNTKYKGIIHCFTGNWQQAKKFIEMGFYIGFNGIIFKLDLNEVIKKTPLDKILIETDCPYLTPPDFYPEQSRRIGEERNNPLGVKIVARYIAKIKNIPLEKISEITTKNAKELFKIF